MCIYNSLKVEYLSYSKVTLHQRRRNFLFSFFSVCGGLDYYPSPLQNLLKKTITTKQISLLAPSSWGEPNGKQSTSTKSRPDENGENQPGELSVSMYISVVEYIPPRTVRFTYQSTSLPSSPAPCQISSTSVARCLKLVGKFNGCAYAQY